MKECRHCDKLLPLSEFYAHRGMADGHLNQCKECVRTRVKGHYHAYPTEHRARDRARSCRPARREQIVASNKRLRIRDPQRSKAWNAVSNALRDGRLIRAACEGCGDEKSEAHHDDYAKPLEVRWLCFKCHRKHHGQFQEETR